MKFIVVTPHRHASGIWTRCAWRLIGEVFSLWRAVDEDGNVLDILMQRRRNKAAALKFLKKLLKKHLFAPRVLVTDKLKSYAAAKKELLPHVEHRYS